VVWHGVLVEFGLVWVEVGEEEGRIKNKDFSTRMLNYLKNGSIIPNSGSII
jgi:hypothetical protein